MFTILNIVRQHSIKIQVEISPNLEIEMKQNIFQALDEGNINRIQEIIRAKETDINNGKEL